jgi:hypothetical protein
MPGVVRAVGATREKFLAGDPCDVPILTATQIAALAAEGRMRGFEA